MNGGGRDGALGDSASGAEGARPDGFEQRARIEGLTWNGAAPPTLPRPTALETARGALRLVGFVAVTLALLPIFFAARAMGGRRDRAIAALWCGAGARLSGLTLRRIGRPVTGGGALMCNHASWLDIMTLGAAAPVHFVAKAEVSGWPLFGWIGRIANTVFIERRRAAAKAQEADLAARAAAGDLLCIFPEGTSTDGSLVLPFKSSIFALSDALGERAQVQPVSIHYAPGRSDLPSNFYGWWGDMALFSHIWSIVCLSRRGVATIEFHPPLDQEARADRKRAAREARDRVADGVARAARALERA